MVKKLFFLFSAVTAILTMASCSNEADDLMSNASESVENVTLTVNVPDVIQSRAVNSDVAISSGSCINKLHFAMYLTGTTTVVYTSEDTKDAVHYDNMDAEYDNDSKTFSISLPYVPKSQGFDIVFWACHEEDAYKVYAFDYATQSVTIDYTGIKNNEEYRDAFFTSEKNVMLSNSDGKTITLRRPFAQLNIGTNDVAGALQAGLTYSSTEVTVKNVYSKLNLLTGIASVPVDVTFAASEANDSQKNPWPLEDQAGYSWISMNYVLTGSELLGEDAESENLKDVNEVNKAKKENMDIEFTLYGTTKANQAWSKSYQLSAIPFQRNYRTFITGQLCTTSNDQLKILIAPDFYGYYVENQDPKKYE